MSSHSVRLNLVLRTLIALRSVLRVEATKDKSAYSVGVYNGLDYAISILQGKDINLLDLEKDNSKELENGK